MSRKPTHPTCAIYKQPREVQRIWYSRDEDLETEVFDDLPDWMAPVEQDLHSIDLGDVVKAKMEMLTEREQKLLELRFWEGMTFREVGKVFDVCVDRIRQIEAKALRKLRHPSRSDDLRPYADIKVYASLSKTEDHENAEQLMEERRQEMERAKWEAIPEDEREDRLLEVMMESRSRRENHTDQ